MPCEKPTTRPLRSRLGRIARTPRVLAIAIVATATLTLSLTALQKIKTSLSPAERKLDSNLVLATRQQSNKATAALASRLQTGVALSVTGTTSVAVSVTAVAPRSAVRCRRGGHPSDDRPAHRHCAVACGHDLHQAPPSPRTSATCGRSDTATTSSTTSATTTSHRFQDGPIAQSVNVVTAAGALYFSSAGHEGNTICGTSGNDKGDLVDSGRSVGKFAGAAHDFDPGPGVHVYEPISDASGQVVVPVFWAEPLGAAASDYDLYGFDASGNVVGQRWHGNNLCQVVFDDTASTAFSTVVSADAPYTGSWKPADPLASLITRPADGQWTFTVSDNAGSDTGNLQAFSLHVTGYQH